jgi:hypothetical protein
MNERDFATTATTNTPEKTGHQSPLPRSFVGGGKGD